MKKDEEIIEKTHSGWGIAGLIFGLMALLLALIPFVGFFFAMLGGIFSIIGIIKQSGKGMAIAGLILSIIGFVVNLTPTILLLIILSSNKATPQINQTQYNIGEQAVLEGITYVVTKTEFVNSLSVVNQTQTGIPGMEIPTGNIQTQKPRGIFFIVYLSAQNTGNNPSPVSLKMNLIDSKNRTFTPDTQTERIVQNLKVLTSTSFLSSGESLQPSFSTDGARIFDISSDATELKLQIKGASLFSSKSIQISLKK